MPIEIDVLVAEVLDKKQADDLAEAITTYLNEKGFTAFAQVVEFKSVTAEEESEEDKELNDKYNGPYER